MPPYRIGRSHCEHLMRPQEEFVGELTKERTHEKNEKAKQRSSLCSSQLTVYK